MRMRVNPDTLWQKPQGGGFTKTELSGNITFFSHLLLWGSLYFSLTLTFNRLYINLKNQKQIIDWCNDKTEVGILAKLTTVVQLLSYINTVL